MRTYKIYMICKHFVDNIFQQTWVHFSYRNGFMYRDQIWIILFTIKHLFAHNLMVSSIAIKYK